MDFAGINFLAVLLASGASFLFGGYFYQWFGAAWLEAIGTTEEELREKGGFEVQPQLVSFLGQFISAFVLAGILGHLGADAVTLTNGLIVAVFTWLGFNFAPMVTNHRFEGMPLKLTLIDGAHWLGVMLIQGAVIGAMGV